MKIINSMITEDTANRFLEILNSEFSDLKRKKIILNYANSKFNEDKYKDYLIINKVNAIKNCVNKKRMFKLLQLHNVSSLEFYNLYSLDFFRCLFVLKKKYNSSQKEL